MNHHLPSKARNMSLAVTVHIADVLAHCGRLDASKINTAAGKYLSESKATSISRETFSRTVENVTQRVKTILEA